MFKTARKLKKDGFTVEYELNKKGEEIKLPRRYICPKCIEVAKRKTTKPSLQRALARKIIIGTKKRTKLAICSKCGYWRKKVGRKTTWAAMGNNN